jgi:hypothetical protein
VRRWLIVRWHCQTARWLTAAAAPCKGSAVSPVLANLFMHSVFDAWMTRRWLGIAFKCYVNAAVMHCATYHQEVTVQAAIENKMAEPGCSCALP